MTALLVLTAILLLTSSVTKLRAAARAQIGLHLLSVLEGVGAMALASVALSGSLTADQGMKAVVGAVVAILVSSLHLGSRLGRQRRLRDLTEGRRLQNYLNYLSVQPEEPGQGGTPPGATPR
jgi:hypothetical protein